MTDSYTKWVMTSKFAEAMQSASQSGNKIEWVRVVSSDDTHAFSDLPGFDKTTLDTARARQTALVNSVTVKGNTVTLTALFTNYKNEIDYYIRTLFLVAKYNGVEFLAGTSIANTDNSAFRMPAASVTEITEFTTRPQISVTSTGVISTTVDPVTAATNERVNGVETTLQTQIDAINEDKVSLWAEFAKYVTKSLSETISGVKTFTETIVGSITGNAGSASKLQTPRKLKVNLASTADQTFDGSADQVGVGVSGVLPIVNGGTGRTDGRANIAAKLVPTNTDFDTLTTDGLYFSAYNSGYTNYPSGTSGGWFSLWVTVAGGPRNITQEYTDTNLRSTYKRFSTSQGGNFSWSPWFKFADDASLVHNTGNETIAGSKTFSSPIVGSLTGSASKLQTARKINGVAFDGSQDITINAETTRWKLNANTNLNTLFKEGHFHCIDNDTAETILGNPYKTTHKSFYMDVMYADGYARQQTWHHDNPNLSYARTYNMPKKEWTAWTVVG